MKLTISILLFLLPYIILSCNYCEFGADNTMCQYGPNACPAAIYANGVTQEDIDTILKTHNDLRSQVATGLQPGQPPAANMEEMKWDSELAKVAQRWADQCTFGHDSNRRTCGFSYPGQNVFRMTFSSQESVNTDFRKAIESWYSEVSSSRFKTSYIESFVFDYETGHYTQVAWATSNRVGCGYLYYGYYNKYYVCNYGPGGNVIGGVMYKIGNPASLCLNGPSPNYPGLCSS